MRLKNVVLVIIVLPLFFINTSEILGKENSFNYEREFARASIVKIEKFSLSADLVETRIRLKVLDGIFKGEIKTAVFKGEDDMPGDMRYEEGDTLYIGISNTGEQGSSEYVSLYDYDNTSGIVILIVLLVLVILLIGRVRGLFSLLALIVTILLLFFIFIPLTLKGYPSLPIAIAISIVSILITLPIIAGFKLKTLAAILGASAGIVIAALLAVFFGWIMHLSGIVTNEMLTVFYAADVEINLKSIALSGMIISALGAIMDVCISIASSTAEIFSANPEIPEKDAIKSVLNIGTDILGSMVNTLILAYVGSSLSLILFISLRMEPGMPFWMVINYNPILSEIVKSAVGSIGMFLCVPLTAYISVRLYKMRGNL